jgi:hypothetical protein
MAHHNPTTKAHTHYSSYRETVIEHLFVGAVLRTLWCAGPVPAEVMKPQVDDAGYDLVLEANGVMRHIQLKSSFRGSKTASQKVHLRLGDKPGGCVVWVIFDPATLELGPFLWFGAPAGEPLPGLGSFKIARHSKGDSTGYKAERPMIRVVPKGQFELLNTTEQVVASLFGLHAGQGMTAQGSSKGISTDPPFALISLI